MAKTAQQRKFGSCARSCKGNTATRFRSCMKSCTKGGSSSRSTSRRSKSKAKGRCTKWSKGRTRCMKRA